MIESVAREQEALARIRVAFQGELGAYGDEAITQRWRGTAIPVPSLGFADVITATSSGLAEYGILPVWNTVVGDITRGCAAVRLARSGHHGLVAVGEIHVAVRHQLLALPASTLGEIESVASHPVALAQCGRFLAQHPRMRPQSVYDTAGAARDIATECRPGSAAIASRAAAERYGLVVLRPDIQDLPDNTTRFLVLAPPIMTSGGRGGRAAEQVQW